MDYLYLEIFNHDQNHINVPLESLIVYLIYEHCNIPAFNLIFVLREKLHKEPFFTINVKKIFTVLPKNNITYCTLPIVVKDVTIISGLSSVCRQIIKSCPENDPSKKLLGFRDACLMACNESSIWTKFCEIDMIQTTKKTLESFNDLIQDGTILIPKDLTRFECHLSQPVRVHNVYKVAQDLAKLNQKDVSEINTKIPKEQLELQHIYGEGPYMTLADVILCPMVHILLQIFGDNIFKKYLPLTFSWYKNMTNKINIINFDFKTNCSLPEQYGVNQDNINKQSLYISDPQRYKPRNRIYTKNVDILNALGIIKDLNINIKLCEKPFGHNIDFDWNKIPLEANPESGALPASRMKRKCDQLENIAKPIIKIAKPGQTIIDFCSGSGHLGILLAVKLPKCKIILLENKEKSLNRARERVEKLQLQNVTLLQCNLDYFSGNFDIGVSLHACGVATDLVIEHCLKRNAAFVSCPCCYGGVHICHHIDYPRSKIFRDSKLTLWDYLVLGHSADQTHDAQNVKTKQGIECMNIIDTDRKLYAEEFGYEVTLAKMIPENCTPKNNLLVGLPKNYIL